MPDPRFYRRAGPLSLARLAEVSAAAPAPGTDAARFIADVAAVETATSADVVYVADKSYLPALAASHAGACFVTPALAAQVPSACAALVCSDPRAAFAAAAAAFYPDTAPVWPSTPVAADAKIDPTASIAPGAVVGARAAIGPRTRIGPHAAIGPGVVIGADCVIGAGVTVICALLSDRVVVHPGARIGQDGFGFTAGPEGPRKIPQLGRVLVGDDVEIGANCTIDRGMLADTVVGRACKLDNLVQIGHNVVLGQGCIVVAQVGISGSCTIGDGAVIGGQAGLADHVSVGAGAQIAAQSGIMRDVAPREAVMGYPAKPIRQFWREIAALARLVKKS